MTFDKFECSKANDRQAYRIESLPDELAAMLEAGLNELRVPLGGTLDDGDAIIGQASVRGQYDL
jgi:hypothetical protein